MVPNNFSQGPAILLAALLALTFHSTVFAAPDTSGDKVIYCCDLPSGQPACGDTLPAVCYGRNYREISSQGITRRSVEGAISPEEQARRATAERIRKEEEQKRKVQEQADKALLSTYVSLADLDARRDRQIARVQVEIDALNDRRDTATKEKTKVEEELAGYASAKKPQTPPPELLQRKQAAEDELASVRTLQESKGRDIEAIRERFEVQRKRYIELTGGSAGK